jgi:hypothetical protein
MAQAIGAAAWEMSPETGVKGTELLHERSSRIVEHLLIQKRFELRQNLGLVAADLVLIPSWDAIDR